MLLAFMAQHDAPTMMAAMMALPLLGYPQSDQPQAFGPEGYALIRIL